MVTDPSEHSRKEVLFRPRDVTSEFQKSDEGYQLSKLKREKNKTNKQEKKITKIIGRDEMRYGEIQKQKWKLIVLTCKFLHKVIAQNEELAISQRQHKNTDQFLQSLGYSKVLCSLVADTLLFNF